MLVGDRLRARRIHLGLAITSVAEGLGIEPRAYEEYEAGVVQAPASLLAEIANLLDIPVLWFFQDIVGRGGEDERATPCLASPPSYRVATMDERILFLAESFRNLDLEGQQHLLAIAAALSRSKQQQARE